MAEPVGSIYYEVDARTGSLLESQRQVNRSTKKMERDFGKVDRSVTSTIDKLGELKTTVTAVAGALAVQKIVRYADAWTAATNKIRIVSDSQDEFTNALDRTFKIAQNSRNSFQATTDLYSKLARTNRTLKRSQEEVFQVTETVSKAVALSGASAEAAEGAVIQFAQALSNDFSSSGQEMNSILEQTPGLAEAIAKGMGTTSDKLKAMGMAGELSAERVFDALLKVGAYVDGEFNKTMATFGQNWQKASDNVMRFVGESQGLNTVIQTSGQAIVGLSNSLDGIVQIATIAGAAIGGRMVNALANQARQAYDTQRATIAKANSDLAAAKASETSARESLRVAQSERAAAQRALETSRATVIATGNTTNRARALEQLAVANGRVAASEARVAAATRTTQAAMAAANVTARALRSAYALLGGPGGLILLGAYALYELSAASKQASDDTDVLTKSTDEFTKSLKSMTQVQASAEIVRLGPKLEELKGNLSDATEEVDKLQRKLSERQSLIVESPDTTSQLRANSRLSEQAAGIQDELTLALDGQRKAQDALNTAQQRSGQLQDLVNGKFQDAIKNTHDSADAVNSAAEAWDKYVDKLRTARDLIGATAQQEAQYHAMQEGFTGTQAEIAGLIAAQTDAMRGYQSAIADGDSEEAQAHLNQAQRYAEKQAMLEQQLGALQDANSLLAGVQSNLSAIAVATATNVAAGAKATAERVKSILDALQAQAANIRINTTVNTSTSSRGDSAAEKAKRETERLQEEMSRRRKAVISSLQTESEAAYAEYQQRNVEIQSLFEDGSDQQLELLDRNNEDYLSRIREIHQRERDEQQRHQEELAKIRQEDYATRLQEITGFSDQAVQKLLEIQTNAADPMAALTRNLGDAFVNLDDTIASTFVNAMSRGEGLNDILGEIGRTVLASLLQSFIKLGVQIAVNAAMGSAYQSAAAATAAATGATIAASYAPAAAMVSLATLGANAVPAAAALSSTTALASGLAIAGGRQYGGNVTAGSAYRVTEDGKPEMYSDGARSYLLPGRNGKVTANKDMGGGGGGVPGVTVQLYGQGAENARVSQSEGPNREQIIQIMLEDAYENGPVRRAYGV